MDAGAAAGGAGLREAALSYPRRERASAAIRVLSRGWNGLVHPALDHPTSRAHTQPRPPCALTLNLAPRPATPNRRQVSVIPPDADFTSFLFKLGYKDTVAWARLAGVDQGPPLTAPAEDTGSALKMAAAAVAAPCRPDRRAVP